jgi:anti-sigma-K factor RskA
VSASQPSHTEIEELLGVYALDAVEAEERDLVEVHLAACARCRAEVEQHREVASLLAHTGEPAPEGIWDRIAATLEDTPPPLELPPPTPLLRAPVPRDAAAPAPARAAPAPAPAPPADGRSTWTSRVAAGVLAVAASIVIALLAFQVRDLNDQIDRIERREETAAVERGYVAALGSEEAVQVNLASDDGTLDAQVVLTPDGRGYLQAAALPRLPDDRTYQLWGVTPDEEVLSLGVFGSRPAVEAFAVAGEFVQLALTEEEAPGVVVSEQPAVVAGAIDA